MDLKKTKQKTKKKYNKSPSQGRFKYAPQPTPEQKKAGWKRRQLRQKLMDLVLESLELPIDQVETKLNDMSKNNTKLIDAIGMKYAFNALNDDRFMIDFFDRHVEKAPVKTEITGEEGGPITISDVLNQLEKE